MTPTGATAMNVRCFCPATFVKNRPATPAVPVFGAKMSTNANNSQAGSPPDIRVSCVMEALSISQMAPFVVCQTMNLASRAFLASFRIRAGRRAIKVNDSLPGIHASRAMAAWNF
jgi:hypothetical protein